MSTPIRLQYLELKQRYPETILFFRLGDFYETFDDDAKLVAAELQITLTSKPMGKDLPRAAGRRALPQHRRARGEAGGARLPRRDLRTDGRPGGGEGHRPARRRARGHGRHGDRRVVARRRRAELPRGLRPMRGTRPASHSPTSRRAKSASPPGEEALRELTALAPAELLVEDADRLPGEFPAAAVVNRPQMSDMAAEAAIAAAVRRARPRDAGRRTPAEAAALAHLLAYLRETYRAALGALQRVRHAAGAGVMTIDPRTLRNLDVLPGPGRQSSLFGVLDRAESAMGAGCCASGSPTRCATSDALGARHDAVGWATRHPIEREQAPGGVLRGMPDIGRLVGKRRRALCRAARPGQPCGTGCAPASTSAALLQRSKPSRSSSGTLATGSRPRPRRSSPSTPPSTTTRRPTSTKAASSAPASARRSTRCAR